MAESVEADSARRVDALSVARSLIPRQSGPPQPAREQAYQALSLLAVPATAALIIEVHTAFFGVSDLAAGQLSRLRRDEERSYRAGPPSRPSYLCAALTADQLMPARGLFAVSTWPLERRIVGPLSRRVDFLTAAARLAGQADCMPGASRQVSGLLRRLADDIPGAAETFDVMRPAAVAEAALAELAVHARVDAAVRGAAAERARARLSEVERLFGAAPPFPPGR